jgi:hypothetical protein
MILAFLTCKKNLSFQFFDLDIENSLGRGTLAKFEFSLYDRTGPIRIWRWPTGFGSTELGEIKAV